VTHPAVNYLFLYVTRLFLYSMFLKSYYKVLVKILLKIRNSSISDLSLYSLKRHLPFDLVI